MENVNEVLADANAKIAKSFETLKSQFAGLRTGKASPALVDGVKVDYYGAPTPIKNLATISTPEPRQIKIAPFDPSVLGEMNKAMAKKWEKDSLKAGEASDEAGDTSIDEMMEQARGEVAAETGAVASGADSATPGPSAG